MSTGEKSKAAALLKAMAVRHNADRHLRLYLREKNGLLIFRAYLEYRRAGLEVPENILRKFDEWAAALLPSHSSHGANGDSEVAAAIEAETRGRHTSLQRLASAESGRDAVEHLIHAEEAADGAGLSKTAALKAVAAERGVKAATLKVTKTRWLSPGRPAQKASAGAHLQMHLSGRLRRSRE